MSSDTRAAWNMLWVTRTTVTWAASSVMSASILPVAMGSSGGARLVHEEHLGLDGQRPGDAQALLLAAREPDGRLAQPVLDDVPQRGVAQGRLARLAPAATWSARR